MSYDLAVLGLGYVGLPLVQAAVLAGLSVVGVDVDETTVAGLNAGRSHVDDLTDEDVSKLTRAGFVAGVDEDVIARSSAVVICVPTPLSEDGGPDLAAVRSAARMVARNLRPGMLVVLESTTYPGTTEEVLRPLLEESGLHAGPDFSLAFSPERIDPGNTDFSLRNTPKIVGGLTSECTQAAATFYSRFIDVVVQASGTREAEMAKLLENTYRHVNIALVNEMARFCHELGIDLWDAIRCASTKPFGFQPFYPGPGVGGHCIPIDPNYLSHNVRARLGYPFRFVELAQEINAMMPSYVTSRVQGMLNADRNSLNGAQVLLLGVTYKADIADQRESPALPLARRLMAGGARVDFHDPLIEEWVVDDRRLRCVPDLEQALARSDVAVLLQAHRVYDGAAIVRAGRRVLDTRGVLPPAHVVERL